MHIRRIVKAGQTSHTVSLPKDWLDKNKLKKGDTLYINERSDNALLITLDASSERTNEKKEIVINIDKKELSTIQREITSAYINNYSSINLVGDSIASKTQDLRKILHDFVALEIAEQSSKHILAQNLLNHKEVPVDKTIKRMDMILRSMIQDISQNNENSEVMQTINFRDFDINKIYFLISRLLKTALNNSSMAQDFKLNNSQIVDNWFLCSNIEGISDCCKNICSLKLKKDEINSLKKTFSKVEEIYTEVMKSYYNKDKSLADSVAKRREELIKETEKLNPTVSENIKQVSNLITNIARIVIDGE